VTQKRVDSGRARTDVHARMSAYLPAIAPTRSRTTADSGATAVEYALLVAAIAGVIVAVVLGLGLATQDAVNRPCEELAKAGSPC
jgi:Flp pilus assembly pilin Flp